MQKIIRNRIRCKKCGDIIESTSFHDFKQPRRDGIDMSHASLAIRGMKEE